MAACTLPGLFLCPRLLPVSGSHSPVPEAQQQMKTLASRASRVLGAALGLHLEQGWMEGNRPQGFT